MSFIRIHWNLPKSFGHFTQISIIAGNANPSADRQKAPNKEMKRPNIGIVSPSTTRN